MLVDCEDRRFVVITFRIQQDIASPLAAVVLRHYNRARIRRKKMCNENLIVCYRQRRAIDTKSTNQIRRVIVATSAFPGIASVLAFQVVKPFVRVDPGQMERSGTVKHHCGPFQAISFHYVFLLPSPVIFGNGYTISLAISNIQVAVLIQADIPLPLLPPQRCALPPSFVRQHASTPRCG